ncbi:MAG: SH3 domain-containing protein [Nitrospinota bacterium]|nr:SH3 domain-containing protein [Nitrospinota bacterium]
MNSPRFHFQARIVLLSLLISFVFCIFEAPTAEALCINERRANLRQGPGLHYEKLWEVYRFMPFQQLGKKGEWLRVQDLDGDIYWVHKKLTTKSFKCAVIKKKEVNLRTGPGTHYKKVKGIPGEKYFSMKVLKIKDNWVQVMDAWGDKAWVYRPLVWIK